MDEILLKKRDEVIEYLKIDERCLEEIANAIIGVNNNFYSYSMFEVKENEFCIISKPKFTQLNLGLDAKTLQNMTINDLIEQYNELEKTLIKDKKEYYKKNTELNNRRQMIHSLISYYIKLKNKNDFRLDLNFYDKLFIFKHNFRKFMKGLIKVSFRIKV